MLLKDSIIKYVYLVGLIKGIADGFYHYPKNILNTEKVDNEDRQQFDGFVNVINKIVAIVIPLLLGILLTYFSYTSLGKIFFVLFVVMFIISFYLKDDYFHEQKFEIRKFMSLIKENKNIRNALIEPLLSGLTFSSGVMGTIITLSKIYNFKTNLNLGFVDSICAGVSLIACILFAVMIKKNSFNKVMIISGIISFIVLLMFAFFPNKTNLIIYLLVRYSLITSISLISSVVITNTSNCNELNEKYKPEFYCIRDIFYSMSRCFGYIILLIVCLTVGMNYINYIMILPAISILLESIIIGLLSKNMV